MVGGAHTLLWLPRALQMRRELKEAEEAEERELEEQERARAAARGDGHAAQTTTGPGKPEDRG